MLPVGIWDYIRLCLRDAGAELNLIKTGNLMLSTKPSFISVLALVMGVLFLTPDAYAARKNVEIETIKKGEGETAVRNSTVTVHYTGWLQKNGKKFDSSVDRDKPFTFTLGAKQVIQGWDIGVEGMKVGGKRMLIIPPHLAYGSRGAGRSIPPKATLKFEVELLAVVPPKYGHVDNSQLKELLDRGVKIIDIRRQDEWDATGVIKGSQRLTAFDDKGNFSQTFVPKIMKLVNPEDEVIIICRSGNRSSVITRFLSEQQGFKKVYNVTEGINKWIKDGLPVVK